MSSTTSGSRGALALLALLLTGCHRVDADLEIDLRRGDGGFWADDAGLRTVQMCSLPWHGEGPQTDGGALLLSTCTTRDMNESHQMFKTDERDLVGVYVDGDFGARLFWYVERSVDCWALEVTPPKGQRLRVTLPAATGRQLIAPGCVPPSCQIRPCE